MKTVGLLRWVLFAQALILGSSVTFANEVKEPVLDELTTAFKKDYLSLGILLQVVGDFQEERSFSGENGFSISNMRISLSGELDRGFGYFLQTNFINSPAILDAKMYYQALPPVFTIDAGLFKSPFSSEFLISAANIDFVNRSQVVTALVPGRQIGLQSRGGLVQNSLSYAVGVFNGNEFDGNNNDNSELLYAGRLVMTPMVLNSGQSLGHLEVGANTAYSKDKDVDAGRGLLPHFAGKRFLVGSDFRLTYGKILLSGEAIYGRLAQSGGSIYYPWGYHATAGYKLYDHSQVLFR